MTGTVSERHRLWQSLRHVLVSPKNQYWCSWPLLMKSRRVVVQNRCPGSTKNCVYVLSLRVASEIDFYIHHDSLRKTTELTIAFFVAIHDVLLFVWGVQLAFWQGSMGHPIAILHDMKSYGNSPLARSVLSRPTKMFR